MHIFFHSYLSFPLLLFLSLTLSISLSLSFSLTLSPSLSLSLFLSFCEPEIGFSELIYLANIYPIIFHRRRYAAAQSKILFIYSFISKCFDGIDRSVASLPL